MAKVQNTLDNLGRTLVAGALLVVVDIGGGAGGGRDLAAAAPLHSLKVS